MKTKNILCGFSMAVVLQLGMLAGSAQTNKYLFSGAKTNITLPPGTYIITAYGATGGSYDGPPGASPGAEMSGEFNFSASTTLTLLVGGGGRAFNDYPDNGSVSPNGDYDGGEYGGDGGYAGGGGGYGFYATAVAAAGASEVTAAA